MIGFCGSNKYLNEVKYTYLTQLTTRSTLVFISIFSGV